MRLVLAPLIPAMAIWLFGLLSLTLVAYAGYKRAPGTPGRALCLLALLVALANPSRVHETRQPLTDVVAVIADRSPSQKLDGRDEQTSAALASLRKQLAVFPDLEIRVAEPDGSGDGTRLFEAAENLLLDTPPDRVAAIVMISDGQVHDAPEITSTGYGPLHVLLTGDPDRQDRRLSIEKAPKFGIAGETVQIIVRIDDYGPPRSDNARIPVSLRLNGTDLPKQDIASGENRSIDIRLEHAGANVIEIETAVQAGELTPNNNRQALTINGVRDRLRVLLISGEPNPGERTWRNLLKADPAVDLVHFTILRPPHKPDGTPVGELSLISFPTRELFNERLKDFDLIIFDRYQQLGVLSFTHFNNIASYVERGGALLVVTGPDFAEPGSLYQTPLAIVFPAQPTGKIRTGGFKPRVTATGARHPVTETLPGANRIAADGTEAVAPAWGRWFRVIDTHKLSGNTVLVAPTGEPLLVLDKVGKGRVAQLLSDHAWLWARGFEGGGPQAELLRRLAHWLMGEPDLEEESLRAETSSGQLLVRRRSLLPDNPPIEIEFPSGLKQSLPLREAAPGRFEGSITASGPGIYRLNDGVSQTILAAGEINPREFDDLRATDNILRPLASQSGGGMFWLRDGRMPDLRRVRSGRDLAGNGWIGLRETGGYRVQAVESHPLLPAAWLLLISAAGIAYAWRREGR